MPHKVAVLTDSTAGLSPEVVAEHSISVVPLQVVIGSASYDEGVEGGATPEMLASALQEWTPVSTSRPNPEEVLRVIEAAAAAGAEEVVAVVLSAELSGTYESFVLAARRATVPVHVVDSRQVGAGVGFAALAATDVVASGGGGESAAAAARARGVASTSLFYVDTLEYLRRGGRVGAVGALLGSALAVKPILKVEHGRVSSLERVRTSGRALSRIEDLAVEAAGTGPVDVGVVHLAGEQRAAQLTEHLRSRLADHLEGRAVVGGQVGAVLGAHVGPGMVGVVVAPRTY